MSISKRLQVIAKQVGANFTFKGRPVSHTEVFSETGLLPGLVKRADQLASLCLGYDLGASYEDTEQAVLGVKVMFDEFTPEVLRLFCITDVLYEIIRSNPNIEAVALDELMYD